MKERVLKVLKGEGQQSFIIGGTTGCTCAIEIPKFMGIKKITIEYETKTLSRSEK